MCPLLLSCYYSYCCSLSRYTPPKLYNYAYSIPIIDRLPTAVGVLVVPATPASRFCGVGYTRILSSTAAAAAACCPSCHIYSIFQISVLWTARQHLSALPLFQTMVRTYRSEILRALHTSTAVALYSNTAATGAEPCTTMIIRRYSWLFYAVGSTITRNKNDQFFIFIISTFEKMCRIFQNQVLQWAQATHQALQVLKWSIRSSQNAHFFVCVEGVSDSPEGIPCSIS